MGMGRMGVNKEQLVDKNKWLPKTSLPCNLLLFYFTRPILKLSICFSLQADASKEIDRETQRRDF